MVAFDLADRSRHLVAHYTEQGVLPAALARRIFGAGVDPSLHTQLSGSAAAEAALFVLAALGLGALALGWHKRIATAVTWFLLASLPARNPYLAMLSGDILVSIVIFLSLFLPLGASWSLDARRAPQDTSNTLLKVPGAAILL